MAVPWEEGKEEDFRELREGLARIREGQVGDIRDSSESSGEEDMGNMAGNSMENMGWNMMENSESEEEDEEDPGEEKPGERILWAAQHNQLELVRSLLSRDPRLVSTRDSDGYTALHRASYNNHPDMVRLLLQQGADPLSTTEDGHWTPLHSAAKWDSAPCVELLLVDTPPNCLTRGGQTPLHLASLSSSSRHTLELLLSHPDIDPDIPNSQGDTARDVAARNGPLAPLFDAVTPRALRCHRET